MTKQDEKVLIVVPSFKTVFHSTIFSYFKKLFKDSHQTFFRAITDDEFVQKGSLETALEKIHPALLISVSMRPDKTTIDTYTSEKVPIILIDEETVGLTTVSTDNFAGGRMAAEYLISKGKKEIAIVSGRTRVKGGYNAEQRVKGFQDTLTAAGLSFSGERSIEVKNYSREEGTEVMPRLLEKGIDSVFCAAGDDCAIGLMTEAQQRGKGIPNDVAIVGFDDTMVAKVSTPPLTTIRQPLEKITETVYDITINAGSKLLQKPEKILLLPELVPRQSA